MVGVDDGERLGITPTGRSCWRGCWAVRSLNRLGEAQALPFDLTFYTHAKEFSVRRAREKAGQARSSESGAGV